MRLTAMGQHRLTAVAVGRLHCTYCKGIADGKKDWKLCPFCCCMHVGTLVVDPYLPGRTPPSARVPRISPSHEGRRLSNSSSCCDLDDQLRHRTAWFRLLPLATFNGNIYTSVGYHLINCACLLLCVFSSNCIHPLRAPPP
jgi:hypothetical protein